MAFLALSVLGACLPSLAEEGVTRQSIEIGAPVDWIPLEPVAVELNVAMLAAKAAHPNAARLIIDYLISKEGQEFLKTFRRVGPRKDVKADPPKLFEGFRRRVVSPDAYKNLRELSKLHNDAPGVR